MSYDIRIRPMTAAEIQKAVEGKDDLRISGIVTMTLDEVIGYDGETFLDVISERLVGSCLLMDISYSIIGYDALNMNIFHVLVGGDVSALLEDLEAESDAN